MSAMQDQRHAVVQHQGILQSRGANAGRMHADSVEIDTASAPDQLQGQVTSASSSSPRNLPEGLREELDAVLSACGEFFYGRRFGCVLTCTRQNAWRLLQGCFRVLANWELLLAPCAAASGVAEQGTPGGMSIR